MRRAVKSFVAPRTGQGSVTGLVGNQRGLQELMVGSACAAIEPALETHNGRPLGRLDGRLRRRLSGRPRFFQSLLQCINSNYLIDTDVTFTVLPFAQESAP